MSGHTARFSNGISDLEIVESGHNQYLYAASGREKALTAYSLSVNTSGFAFERSLQSSVVSPILDIEQLIVGGQTHVVPFGIYDWTLKAFPTNATDDFVVLNWGTGGVGNLSGFATASIGGQTYLYAANAQSTGFIHYKLSGGTQLERISTHGQPSGTAAPGLVDIDVTTIGGQQYLLALSRENNSISSYHLDGNGAPNIISQLNSGQFLPISEPTAMAIGNVAGRSFAIVASAGSSSLTVLEIGDDGALNAVDHVLDNKYTRFQKATEIIAVEVNDRLYIVSAGADDGLSLFAVLPDGTLVHLDSIADDNTASLNNVSALAGAFVGDTLQIFASSETEGGISRFDLDLSNIGAQIIGGAGNDTLHGGSLDNIILGGAGHDIIRGGAGDDIISDGSGHDTLFGGAGQDNFVLFADGEPDTIGDYQVGLDKLDLSSFSMLYDVSQLQITPQSWGATITYKNEVINVRSASGQPIAPDAFINQDLLLLNRPPSGFQYVPTNHVGTDTDDQMEGGEGPDNLKGLSGNDTFYWSNGADHFDGGSGVDTVSYQYAPGGIRIDLRTNKSGGAATGDSYQSIENIIGSAFRDHLTGDSAHNKIWGSAGNDTIVVTQGGDHLDGGAGIDAVSYQLATTGVQVDLRNPQVLGTFGGEIHGFENVFGSIYSDILTGTDSANNLHGGAGDDDLNGGGGNDQLSGEAGNDVLSGGAGNNILDGGLGHDSVSYQEETQNVYVDLALGKANGGNFTDELRNIESAIASGFDDTVIGDASANTIFGLAGNDHLHGGGGNDNLVGGGGDDILLGGGGNDRLNGGTGSDTLDGGVGTDTVDYGDAAQRVVLNLNQGSAWVGPSIDKLRNIENILASGFGDTIIGSAGANVIFGFAGQDQLHGGGGNDRLHGGQDNDVLLGGGGNDHIFGDNGDDILNGGAGHDALNGGPGADTFLYSGGADIILDFEAGEDRVSFNSNTWGTGDAAVDRLMSHAKVIDGNVVFSFGDGNKLVIENINDISEIQNAITWY